MPPIAVGIFVMALLFNVRLVSWVRPVIEGGIDVS
ncbi:hypothetical protein ES708_09734 [subsurface metagenome]